LPTHSCRKMFKGPCSDCPWEKHAKFEVYSRNHFEAIYRSQFNDVIVIVTSRLCHCAQTERQTEPQNKVKTFYPPSSLHYTWRGLSKKLRTRWFSGSAVRALVTRPKGPRFNSQPVHYRVTTAGKLFTPTFQCRCKCLVVSVNS